MRHIRPAAATLAALLATTGMALADAHATCAIEGEGSVRILSNDFESLHRVNEGAEACASDAVEVEVNQTVEHKTIQVPALTTDPATYTVAVIANNSFVPLNSAGLLRPMDDYVEAYGDTIQPRQLIRTGEGVMAVAFMANGVHLYYRADLLEENGLEVPTTMEELLAALETLREAGIAHPFASNFRPGWDLAAEFVNMYLGTGGDLFEAGSAELSVDDADGLAVLENMRALSEYMRPAFVTDDANTIMPLWKEGEIAMMFAWGSRAREALDETGSAFAQHTRVAAMPSMEAGGPPAAALWWDGFSIAKNVSDEDAAVSFQAMAHALGPRLAEEHGDTAVWLTTGYEPRPPAVGVSANIQGGARSYPMVPFMGLLHTALGENLGEFIQGQESAEQALDDITAAYETAAREQGFLR